MHNAVKEVLQAGWNRVWEAFKDLWRALQIPNKAKQNKQITPAGSDCLLIRFVVLGHFLKKQGKEILAELRLKQTISEFREFFPDFSRIFPGA